MEHRDQSRSSAVKRVLLNIRKGGDNRPTYNQDADKSKKRLKYSENYRLHVDLTF
jgi:hypothetical protein